MKIFRTMIVALALVFNPACQNNRGADDQIQKQVKERQDYFIVNFFQALQTYEEKIEVCEEIFKSTLPKLEKSKIIDLSISKIEFIAGVGYISLENLEACDRVEFLQTAYHLSEYKYFLDENGISEGKRFFELQKQILKDNRPIEYYSKLFFDRYANRKRETLKGQYLILGEEKKRYLDSLLGSEPFNVFAVLDQYEELFPVE